MQGDTMSVAVVAKPKKLLTEKQHRDHKTIIKVRDIEIGGEAITLMAGPCAIESEQQLVETASAMDGTGVSVIRASAYKPRTSPYSFQGLGVEGLKMHASAQKKHGLVTESEVMDPRAVQEAAKHVDILRVGARNMQNFDLLKELGKCGKPIILKRGIASSVDEWIMSAEYIMAHGNPHVILCERGIRTFETSTRNTLDLSAVAVAKQLTHLPVIVDPSHAAGRPDLIGPLSKAAIAVGADGLLIEVHHAPKESVCDKDQALSPQEFKELSTQLKLIAEACGRKLEGDTWQD
jgi:3-deoxy-7-phosphoheptulonate synthase